jgi:FtsP/CotA-like multicopper oxidase with cupredoxin domain
MKGRDNSMALNRGRQQGQQWQQGQPRQQGVSRRFLLKGGAMVGGTFAVAGGAALATREVITHPNSPLAQAASAVQQLVSPYQGQVREYWIQADAFYHNLVPSGVDGMMGMQYQPHQSSYWALGYRAYTENWGKPLPGNSSIGPNTGIPGPVLRGEVGDTLRVHFRNNDTHYKYPHSMHPHGVQYTPADDGAWISSDLQPGSAVPPGESYSYEWQVHPNSVGTWVYHDHSVPTGPNMLMEFSAELGMFGMLVLTDSSVPAVDKEFFTFLHDIYQADVPSLAQDFDCFNGQSYLGNTPTFTANVGDRIRWHIAALGKEFHAFHLHGHRWPDAAGRSIDVVLLGPAVAQSFDFVANNPGKWLYHCHVTDHMMGGMVGMYIVS